MSAEPPRPTREQETAPGVGWVPPVSGPLPVPVDQPAALRAGTADRNLVTQRLNASYAEGALSLEELEERLEQAYTVRTRAELDTLVADLPPVEDDIADAQRPHRGASDRMAQRRARLRQPLLAIGRRYQRPGPRRRLIVVAALLAGLLATGAVPPDAMALFGSSRIEVPAAADDVTIRTLSAFGSVQIVVPPNANVDLGGLAVFGSRQCEEACPSGAGPDVEIRGLTLFGSVNVVPAEPG